MMEMTVNEVVYIGNGECDQYMYKVVCNSDGEDCFSDLLESVFGILK